MEKVGRSTAEPLVGERQGCPEVDEMRTATFIPPGQSIRARYIASLCRKPWGPKFTGVETWSPNGEKCVPTGILRKKALWSTHGSSIRNGHSRARSAASGRQRHMLQIKHAFRCQATKRGKLGHMEDTYCVLFRESTLTITSSAYKLLADYFLNLRKHAWSSGRRSAQRRER